ncbi:hypothetical protein EUGRSUZ_C03957 [Eucalyptus grandis]|uniref:Uncharacterized protein n=1 Tax=Eucalyptus grandis TaxID=71139 RepID=A0ACC3LJL8_EUCGR|nr:hypothetical protein EUGRSUZ_C03957 [Eucalyptus grandis]
MIRAGIRVFKDNEELHVGEEIGGELLRAISNSKIHIPIFSKNYASSKWCLRELAHMVEHRKRGEKVILPIFYEVDALDLKLRTGSHGKALENHEKQSGKIVAKQWEEALKEVAGIKGLNLKDHRFLDIHENDILSLRKKLSRDILGIQHSKVIDAYEGRDMIEERLRDKKVILILNDMDKKDQLMKLVGKYSRFGPGSKIIVTTRNTHSLAPQTDYQDDNIIPLNHQDHRTTANDASYNYLKRTPNFSKSLNLKRLVLKNCTRLEEIDSSIDQLGHLKYLEFDGTDCPLLRIPPVSLLPYAIDGLKSLSMLKMENQDGIRKLPPSIEGLQVLKHLSLSGCCNLVELLDSIGKLPSLLYLNLDYTSVSALPDSIGGLESLLELDLSFTPIEELPHSIGTLENLEELTAHDRDILEGKNPSEITGLSQSEILYLHNMKVSRLPMTINRLFNLKELDLSFCDRLQLLPDLPTSLTDLKIKSPSLLAVPDLSNLTSLNHLIISDCTLEITCANLRLLTGFPSSLKLLNLQGVKIPIEWSMFSNLDNLCHVLLYDCGFGEIEFDNVIGQLKNLQSLQVFEWEGLVRISNVSSLKEHQNLFVTKCPQLIEIELEPSSTGDCSSIERPLPDALKLEKLCSLKVRDCASLQKVPNTRCTTTWNCPRAGPYEKSRAAKRGGGSESAKQRGNRRKSVESVNERKGLLARFGSEARTS